MNSMEFQKHAYLLETHQYSKVLETLVRMIDDERNDIYVHIDKKVRNPYSHLIAQHVRKSELYFVKNVKVYWGHVSMVKAEYSLFQAAFENGPYFYYHLLSGNDLPIKSQDDIHAFFALHQGEEFIHLGFINEDRLRWVHTRRLFPPRGLCSNETWMGRKINLILKTITDDYVKVLRKVGYTNNKFPVYRSGSNWVSLTNRAVAILLENKQKVLSCFKFTLCPDEFYKQTVLYNEMKKTSGSSHPIRIFHYLDEKGTSFSSSMRLIDWKRGGPYCFTIDDFDEIDHSNAMFCRKIFDENLADRIYERFGG